MRKKKQPNKHLPKNLKIKYRLRKKDPVMIIAGKAKGRSGKILEIDNITSRVLVEGCNIQKKTVKKSKENPSGGIIEKEAPIHISNMMYLDADTPTRLGYKFEKGKKIRVAKKSGKLLQSDKG